MSQANQETPWRESRNLVLEGGGTITGAERIVEIRDKALVREVIRQEKVALVRGEVQLFISYNLRNSELVMSQRADIPWQTEIPVPPAVGPLLDANVVGVQHEHEFDPLSETLQHTMHLSLEVWESQPDKQATPPTPATEQPAIGPAQTGMTTTGQHYDGPEPEWPLTTSSDSVEMVAQTEPDHGLVIVDTQRETPTQGDIAIEEAFEAAGHPTEDPRLLTALEGIEALGTEMASVRGLVSGLAARLDDTALAASRWTGLQAEVAALRSELAEVRKSLACQDPPANDHPPVINKPKPTPTAIQSEPEVWRPFPRPRE